MLIKMKSVGAIQFQLLKASLNKPKYKEIGYTDYNTRTNQFQCYTLKILPFSNAMTEIYKADFL